jgi:hypothetical protein
VLLEAGLIAMAAKQPAEPETEAEIPDEETTEEGST